MRLGLSLAALLASGCLGARAGLRYDFDAEAVDPYVAADLGVAIPRSLVVHLDEPSPLAAVDLGGEWAWHARGALFVDAGGGYMISRRPSDESVAGLILLGFTFGGTQTEDRSMRLSFCGGRGGVLSVAACLRVSPRRFVGLDVGAQGFLFGEVNL